MINEGHVTNEGTPLLYVIPMEPLRWEENWPPEPGAVHLGELAACGSLPLHEAVEAGKRLIKAPPPAHMTPEHKEETKVAP